MTSIKHQSFKDWDIKKREKSFELCRRGVFRQLLTTPQKRFYDMYTDSSKKEVAMYTCRKLGKVSLHFQ